MELLLFKMLLLKKDCFKIILNCTQKKVFIMSYHIVVWVYVGMIYFLNKHKVSNIILLLDYDESMKLETVEE